MVHVFDFSRITFKKNPIPLAKITWPDLASALHLSFEILDSASVIVIVDRDTNKLKCIKNRYDNDYGIQDYSKDTLMNLLKQGLYGKENSVV